MAVATNECGTIPELMDPLAIIVPTRNTVDNVARSELVEYKKHSVSESDSFHRAFSSVIVIAQYFGLMPVYGIRGSSASFIRFSWFNPHVIYTALSLIGTFFMTSLCVIRFFKYGRTFEETQCSVFYGCSFSRMLLFLLLAQHWPALASRWEKVERVLAHHGYPYHQRHKFNLITAIFLSVSFIEHALSHVRVIRLAVLCVVEDKMDGICTFFYNSFPHVYDYFPCSIWNGIIMFIINVICAFAWTYMDLFIVLMSIALADRFEQLNRCLQSIHGKHVPPRFWHHMHKDYNTLSSLVKTVDSCITKMVFLSFANNLYTVCIQLLNSLHPPQNAVQMVYFCLSLGYVLLRMIVVSLSAASVNEQSCQVRNILYSIPATSFSVEVQRFLHQATTKDIALTGLNLFSVRRTLLLTVAGTIVTYEIVLVQYSGIHADERDSTAHGVARRYCL
ncbi:hypothetical protein L798_13962 [Zootermopsis nevadensis]|nr:hypothetical protein L798_13962 [Zootermopsis nevadensis]